MPDTHEGNGWRGGIDVRVLHLEERMNRVDLQVAKIQETVWKAAGALFILVAIVNVWLKAGK